MYLIEIGHLLLIREPRGVASAPPIALSCLNSTLSANFFSQIHFSFHLYSSPPESASQAVGLVTSGFCILGPGLLGWTVVAYSRVNLLGTNNIFPKILVLEVDFNQHVLRPTVRSIPHIEN